MINQSDVKYCHLNNITNKKGTITVASNLVNDRVCYGVSFCSPKDTFKKEQGRKIAFNRLNYFSGDYILLELEEMNHKGIMNAILNTIIDYNEYPDWAEDALLEHISWYSVPKSNKPEYDRQVEKIQQWLNDMPSDVELSLCNVMFSSKMSRKS